MIEYTIASRYAKVLFDLDHLKGLLDRRLEDLTSISHIFHTYPKIVRFLKSPQVTLDEKKRVFQKVFQRQFDPTFMQFIFLLIQKDRLDLLGHIREEYRLKVNQSLDRWEADLETAIPMDQESEAKLAKKLEKTFHKKVHLNKTVNPKILGGVILIISNEMLDWSVRGRLRKLKEKLLESKI